MKISVVTAVFNRRATIGEAIASLQSQTHDDFEHVIQDGGSTDGTLDAVRTTADWRSSLESAPDAGIYDAINRGIRRATGDVVGLLHSDDVFASNAVLGKVARIMSDPAVDGVYGDLQYVSRADPDRVIRHWRAGEFHPDKLARGWMPPHPTLYLRRSLFERLGYYDTSYRIAADYDAVLRWLGKDGIQVAYIPEVLVKMRVGGESNRSLGRIYRKMCEDYLAISRHNVGGIGTLVRKSTSKFEQFFRR